MPETKKCPKCDGKKKLTVLISAHDDKTEVIICPTCQGKGVIHEMTEQEERNYWEDYW